MVGRDGRGKDGEVGGALSLCFPSEEAAESLVETGDGIGTPEH